MPGGTARSATTAVSGTDWHSEHRAPGVPNDALCRASAQGVEEPIVPPRRHDDEVCSALAGHGEDMEDVEIGPDEQRDLEGVGERDLTARRKIRGMEDAAQSLG